MSHVGPGSYNPGFGVHSFNLTHNIFSQGELRGIEKLPNN
jgi:hypothetical protein